MFHVFAFMDVVILFFIPRSVREKQQELTLKLGSIMKKKNKDQLKLEQAMAAALDKINK